MAGQSQADQTLDLVFDQLGLQGRPPHEKYAAIENIILQLQQINQETPINIKTTGSISEKLCKFGIPSSLEEQQRAFGKNWEWVGDMLLPGHPYDIAVSVKSFKAKERLLASGTGSLLTPTIGWGLFDDPSEWSEVRTRAYLYRGFIAIYMPQRTLEVVSRNSITVKNINDRALLRSLADFPSDLENAIFSDQRLSGRLDVRKL
ncbi:MAG TPA: hypothetical protein PLE99_03990 [Candidatus Thiothrix moscowensis]|uniref:hypothetical protein n=1 Tax=unclassified Thiothrix TaxID=2636184 RepID=UPI0025D78D65|nr:MULTISPECIES: hypothetical protein [unclassified Thiothrix]HRJ51906.1 hypothetical protein [Candidatus Thiothrix moscowensis]HRJ92221.1 hypothetical protein [Candidatus Thiothrix moscowensis]